MVDNFPRRVKGHDMLAPDAHRHVARRRRPRPRHAQLVPAPPAHVLARVGDPSCAAGPRCVRPRPWRLVLLDLGPSWDVALLRGRGRHRRGRRVAAPSPPRGAAGAARRLLRGYHRLPRSARRADRRRAGRRLLRAVRRHALLLPLAADSRVTAGLELLQRVGLAGLHVRARPHLATGGARDAARAPHRAALTQRPVSAAQTRAGVIGRSRCVTPRVARASSTALMADGSAPATPDSPAPLTPSGLVVHGTTW